MVMDRHDRGSTFDGESHAEDVNAHRPGGGSPGVHTVQAAINQPDLLGTAEVRLIHAHADWAPNGLTLITVKIDTGESSTYSVDFEIRTEPTDGSPTAVATVATSASTEAETSSLTNADVSVGDYVYATLPATDVNQLGLEVNFTID